MMEYAKTKEWQQAETIVVVAVTIIAAVLAFFAFDSWYAAILFGLVMFIIFGDVGASRRAVDPLLERQQALEEKIDRLQELLERK